MQLLCQLISAVKRLEFRDDPRLDCDINAFAVTNCPKKELVPRVISNIMKLYMKTGIRQHKAPLTMITAALVLVIAVLAGSSLLILRSMQNRSAHVSAAMSVMDLGRVMTAHFGSQDIVTLKQPAEEEWSSFSSQVRSICAMEKGVQYVSVIRDGVTLFHEQRGSFGSIGRDEGDRRGEDDAIKVRRRLMDVGGEAVPVVVFSSEVVGEDGGRTLVEVAIRRDTVAREKLPSEYAIATMFKVTFATVVVSFSVCIFLVVWMMRREVVREARRREEEHLAFAGVMANGIVHDFRNPMSSLRLDVQMMGREMEKESGHDIAKIRNLAERSRKTVDRMDKVFEEFLYVSKPPSDKRETVDLRACLNECVSILEPRNQKDGIKVTLDVPEGAVDVLVYRASFNRALMNVVLNAEQFAPKGRGQIEINVSRNGAYAVIEVIDNGPGVSVTDRGSIFEMFVSGRPGGTGLGLFFARTAIESSGGTISESNRDQGGACFRIEVPLSSGSEV